MGFSFPPSALLLIYNITSYGNGGMLSFNVAVRYEHNLSHLSDQTLLLYYRLGGTLFASVCNYMGGVQLIPDDEGGQATLLPDKADRKCPVRSGLRCKIKHC